MNPPKDHTPATAGERADAKSAGKKPYQKPSFVREQLFETMALACGKTNPSIGQCRAVRRNS
jgi:hypothetical protein